MLVMPGSEGGSFRIGCAGQPGRERTLGRAVALGARRARIQSTRTKARRFEPVLIFHSTASILIWRSRVVRAKVQNRTRHDELSLDFSLRSGCIPAGCGEPTRFVTAARGVGAEFAL